VDLTRDNYVRNKNYGLGDKVILHQKNWECINAQECDSDENNPVGINGAKAWKFLSENLSTLVEE
jgi:hypothetical protein